MKRILFVLAFVFVFAPQWTFADEHIGRETCKVCGMYIDQYHDTSGELIRKDGKQFKTCGVACLPGDRCLFAARILFDRSGIHVHGHG